MKPLITIALPVHNGDKYLSDTRNSLVEQCHDDIEILIINNNSDDNTDNIIQDYKSRYNFIRVIKLCKTISADRNVNKCICEAEGQYVWSIGDDDLLLPKAIRSVSSFISQSKNNIDYIFLNCRRYNRDLSLLLSGSALKSAVKTGNVSSEVLINKIGLNMAFTPTTLINKYSWLRDHDLRYLDTGWYILLNIIKNVNHWNSYIISETYIIFRDGSNRNSLNGKFLIMINTLIRCIYEIARNNQNQYAQILIKSLANQSIFYSVLSAKINGYRLDFKVLKLYFSLIKYNLPYSLYSSIALIVPSMVYKIAFKYRNLIKKILFIN